MHVRHIGHAGIAEIAVVGVLTSARGTLLRRHRGFRTAGARSGRAMRTADTEGVARFKVPERIEVWDALPKNDAGKVLKHQIRAKLMKVDV